MAPRGTVLIADENPLIVEFIVEALRDEGYNAVGLSDGVAATATILAKHPDLALVDLHFGTTSGLEIIQAVREWGLDTPIVIMTAATAQAAALEAQGAATCLLKPFDLDDLYACVAMHIRMDRPAPESAA
jgi:DNA-binding response OmpR family regulator